MKYLLIQYKDNWADEMNVYGFHIMTETAWNFFLKLVNEKPDFFENDFTIGVGSNEDISYENKDDLLKHFKVEEVSKEYSDQTRSLFVLPYGQFPLDQIFEGLTMDMSEEENAANQWFAHEIY